MSLLSPNTSMLYEGKDSLHSLVINKEGSLLPVKE